MSTSSDTSAMRSGVSLALANRLTQLRRRLADKKTGSLLVTCPQDIHYLTGFAGDDSWLLVPPVGKLHLISDSRFQEQIQRDAPQVIAHMRQGAISQELARLLAKRRIRHLALQQDHVTLATQATLAKQLKAVRLDAIDDGLLNQRAVKHPSEVQAIRQALKIQQKAYRRTLEYVRAGQREYEVAAYLEYQMRHLGADGTSFPSIVAAGANASLPHAVPGSAKLKRNDILLIDWGARFQGYCSDLTRVVALGRMPAKMREVYSVVLQAQLAAIDAIAPGVELKAVDAVARRIIEKAGYGDRFGHGLGHGIGLLIHEQPGLSSRSSGVLQAGQVVTVEPGIYLPGIGGVRIEDDVLVTAGGHEVLSDLPKDLQSACLD